MGSCDENQPRFKSDTSVISARSAILRRASSAPTRTVVIQHFATAARLWRLKIRQTTLLHLTKCSFNFASFYSFSRFSHICRSFFSQQRSFINYFIFETLRSGNWRMTHASLIFSYSLIEWRFRELYNWWRLFASNFADRDFRIFPLLKCFLSSKIQECFLKSFWNCGIVENVWCLPGSVVVRFPRRNQIRS